MNWAARARHRADVFATLDAGADHYHMQPLVVTAHMGGALAITRAHDLALDGILMSEMLYAAFDGDPNYSLPPPETTPLFLRIPLSIQGTPAMQSRAATWRWGRVLSVQDDLAHAPWWYAVSTAELVGVAARDTAYWNKRWDTKYTDVLDESVKTVVIEKGRYKAYHQPLPLVIAQSARWHVVGDGDALQRILANVRWIGKKRSQGHGRVLRWDVAPESADRSLWGDDGTLARAVPLTTVPEWGLASPHAWDTQPGRAFIAYRAPQWLPYHQSECLISGQRRHEAAA